MQRGQHELWQLPNAGPRERLRRPALQALRGRRGARTGGRLPDAPASRLAGGGAGQRARRGDGAPGNGNRARVRVRCMRGAPGAGGKLLDAMPSSSAAAAASASRRARKPASAHARATSRAPSALRPRMSMSSTTVRTSAGVAAPLAASACARAPRVSLPLTLTLAPRPWAALRQQPAAGTRCGEHACLTGSASQGPPWPACRPWLLAQRATPARCPARGRPRAFASASVGRRASASSPSSSTACASTAARAWRTLAPRLLAARGYGGCGYTVRGAKHAICAHRSVQAAAHVTTHNLGAPC